MKSVSPLLAIAVASLFAYAIAGDFMLPILVLAIGGAAYAVCLKPSLGGPIFYASIGFLGGFLLALLLGLTLFRNSVAGGYALISFLAIGPAVSILIGRRSNYRLWFSLRP